MTGVTGQFDGQFWSNSQTWRQFDLHIYMMCDGHQLFYNTHWASLGLIKN